MARKKNNTTPVIVRRCGECKHGKEYQQHNCKSVKGEYFCVTCPHYNYVRLKSEKACEKFELKW